ncbi:alpha-amylase-like [Liolophura sinensis]|uniref:alpha-amylase-like n=1 Tax=Liolophura sinensis TaxID=3198878 RepID=UPI0031590FB8
MLGITLIVVLVLAAVSASPYSNEHCSDGRGAFVHLFEWKWKDIAAECERFLGPKGYCGVQISPPSENRVVTNPNRPWWERYQPVSYKLVTRSGNENDFRDMVSRCNKAGVKIYADAVINHMTGVGGSGIGTAGTHYDGNVLSYPGVPFSGYDFHGNDVCHTGSMNIENYNDANQVRNCRLVSLADLNGGKNYVREKVAGYLNHLIDLGVAGFRIDAAKHMWPGDIGAILSRTKNVHAGGKAFVFQEVIDMGGEAVGQAEYLGTGRVTSFPYGKYLADAFRGRFPLKNLKTFGSSWSNMVSPFDAVVFIDNHDNQRGHGGGGSVLTHSESRLYKLANAFMLAHSYGYPKVMSSFNFRGSDEGPPHNGDMSIKDVSVNSDDTCGNGWICEHRWRQIYNMVAFRRSAYGTSVNNWWDNGGKQIAFSRGNKAFIVMNLEGFDLNTSLSTGLPGGNYCDVISGNKEGNRCTGKTITVGSDHRAHFSVSHRSEDPMVAIHVGAKL